MAERREEFAEVETFSGLARNSRLYMALSDFNDSLICPDDPSPHHISIPLGPLIPLPDIDSTEKGFNSRYTSVDIMLMGSLLNKVGRKCRIPLGNLCEGGEWIVGDVSEDPSLCPGSNMWCFTRTRSTIEVAEFLMSLDCFGYCALRTAMIIGNFLHRHAINTLLHNLCSPDR